MKKAPNYFLNQQERILEPGVAISDNPHDPLWWVRVGFTTGLKPSTETIRASSEAQAREFVLARYPFADPAKLEVLGRVGKVEPPVPEIRHTSAARAAAAPAPAASTTPASAPPVVVAARPSPRPVKAAPAPAPSRPKAKAPGPAQPAAAAESLVLEPLPRDAHDRAVFQPDTDAKILAAKRAGWTWDRICASLDCSSRQAERRFKAYMLATGQSLTPPPALHAELPTGAPVIQALMADGDGYRTVPVTLLVHSPDVA